MSYYDVRAEGSAVAVAVTDNATSLDEREATAAAVEHATARKRNYVIRKHTGAKGIIVATVTADGDVVVPQVGVPWVADPAVAPRFCEHRPYPGAGYWCLADAGHYPATPHTDLTILWDDQGNPVNLDGSRV